MKNAETGIKIKIGALPPALPPGEETVMKCPMSRGEEGKRT